MAIYMKVDGIDGHVSAKGHEKSIELESFQWNISRKMCTTPGNTSLREGSRPNMSEVVVTKRVDGTSPLLFSHATTTSKAIPQVIISVVRTDANLSTHIEYTLSDVIISNFGNIHSAFDANGSLVANNYPLETLALNYTKVEYKVIPTGPDNHPMNPVSAIYNANTAAAA